MAKMGTRRRLDEHTIYVCYRWFICLVPFCLYDSLALYKCIAVVFDVCGMPCFVWQDRLDDTNGIKTESK